MLMVKSDVFKIYSYSEDEAIGVFIDTCDKYMKTTNEYYKEYWNNLRDLVQTDRYIVLENTDFIGIRKTT